MKRQIFRSLVMAAIAATATLVVASPAPAPVTPPPIRTHLAGGETSMCGLTPAGDADCWGTDTPFPSDDPTADRPGPFTELDSGDYFHCALRPDGTSLCWGGHNAGWSPVTQYKQISVEKWGACGVKLDDTIGCWGDSLPTDTYAPGTYVEVAVGHEYPFACGITTFGAVQCFGEFETEGLLDRSGPYIHLAIQDLQVCALALVGQIDCWSTGPGTTTYPGPYAQLDASSYQVCALTTTGAADCLGATVDDRPGPFTEIDANHYYVCGITTSRAMECWGDDPGDYGVVINDPGPWGPPLPPPPCTMNGTSGNDLLKGTPGDDVICGLEGNDTILGKGGNDILRGGDDADKLGGGLGDDGIEGGAGLDTVVFTGATGPLTVDLGLGNSTGQGSDTISEVESATGASYGDFMVGSYGNNKLTGGGGADTLLDYLGGIDTLVGGPGEDVIDAADGVSGDKVAGGPDTDACSGDYGDKVTGCEA